jgi:uncharacterized membrane protein YqaE (UPF0057 family)
MRKLFYLLVITLFISSCSTTNFVGKKKDFNGNKLTFAHKDVQKTEVEPVKKADFVQKQNIKSNKSIALLAEKNDLKPLKRIFKSVAKEVRKSEVAAQPENVTAELIIDNFVIPSYEKTSLSQGDYEKSAARRGPDKGLLIVLSFFIPWLAVGLATDWDIMPIVYNVLWTMLCGIPGIIHAIIVVSRMR